MSEDPLQNSLVICQISTFLGGPDLLRCRLLNRQWNSICVQQLQARCLCNCIDLRGNGKLRASLKFLRARADHVEWHLATAKYKTSVTISTKGSADVEYLSALALQSLDSLSLAFRETRLSFTKLDQIFVSLKDTLSGTMLTKLRLEFNQFDDHHLVNQCFEQLVSLIPRVLQSPVAIRKLELVECYANQLVGMVQSLCSAPISLLSSVEQLTLALVSGPSGRRFLQALRTHNVQFPGLGRTKLRWTVDNCGYEYWYTQDWPSFPEFVHGSCPLATHCNVELVRIGVGEFLDNTELEAITGAFPGIVFQFSSKSKPDRGVESESELDNSDYSD